jgi:hypothetical protein
MSKSRVRVVLLVGIAIVSSLLLLACGDSTSTVAPSNSTQIVPVVTTPATTSKPLSIKDCETGQGVWGVMPDGSKKLLKCITKEQLGALGTAISESSTPTATKVAKIDTSILSGNDLSQYVMAQPKPVYQAHHEATVGTLVKVVATAALLHALFR